MAHTPMQALRPTAGGVQSAQDVLRPMSPGAEPRDTSGVYRSLNQSQRALQDDDRNERSFSSLTILPTRLDSAPLMY